MDFESLVESAAADSLASLHPRLCCPKKSSDSVPKNLSASQMELAPFERRGPVKDLVAPIRFLYLELAPFETVLTANPQVATPRHG